MHKHISSLVALFYGIASLKFQPIKRPQIPQKPKARPIPSSSSPDKPVTGTKPPLTKGPISNSIEKWTTEDDFDENPYAAEFNRRREEERQRSRWNKKSRKKQKKGAARIVDYDEIYDPDRPTRLEDYKGSEEQARAEHDWKAKLHAHQMKKRPASARSSDRSSTEREGSKIRRKMY